MLEVVTNQRTLTLEECKIKETNRAGKGQSIQSILKIKLRKNEVIIEIKEGDGT